WAGGIALNGTTGALNATGIAITTHGDKDPVTGFTGFGIFNGPFDAFHGGGTATVSNSTITTTGSDAVGVETRNGGKTTFTGGSITTSGAQSDAVLALSGAQVNVQGTTISTSGNAGKGFDVQGTGTTLVASNLSVTTTGTINPATGNHAQGLYNGNGVGSDGGPTGGASATLTNVAILTKGFFAAGVATENGATTMLNGGSVSTTGAASYAVVVNSAGAVTANGTALSAAANGSGGFSVQGAGSRLAASGVTVATLGALDRASGNHSY